MTSLKLHLLTFVTKKISCEIEDFQNTLYKYERLKKNIRRDEMTFLALDAQKNLFTLQKSQLQFEQTLVMSRVNYITKQMGYRAQELEAEDIDTDDDPTYIQLQQEESYLETRQDSLDSQISLMENEISSLKNLVNSNIKSSCTLNLIGG